MEKQEDKRLVKKNGDRWRKWEQEQGGFKPSLAPHL